jgi:hypothetical protein
VHRDPQAICWEEEGAWLGFWRDYPRHWTQGESLRDLQAHLDDLLADIRSGEIPGAALILSRRTAPPPAEPVGAPEFVTSSRVNPRGGGR